MSRLSTVPASLVGESWVVNIPCSSVAVVALSSSDLVSKPLGGSLLFKAQLSLLFKHFLSHFLSSFFIINWDLLFQNYLTNSCEFRFHVVNFCDWICRHFFEAKWVWDNFLEVVLCFLNSLHHLIKKFISVVSISQLLKEAKTLRWTLSLILTDGTFDIVFTSINDPLQNCWDMALAIIGRQDRLEKSLLYVCHVIVTMVNSRLDQGLNLLSLKLFCFWWLTFNVFESKEIMRRQDFVNNSLGLTFRKRMVIDQFYDKIFSKLLNK